MKSKLHNLINRYYRFRQLVQPNTEDSLLFLLSEIGELCEAYMKNRGHYRINPNVDNLLLDMCELGQSADRLVSGNKKWIRNNDRIAMPNVESEVGDCLMMLERFASNMGIDPYRALVCKMKAKGFDSSAPDTEQGRG